MFRESFFLLDQAIEILLFSLQIQLLVSPESIIYFEGNYYFLQTFIIHEGQIYNL